jgi:hypothetical protein
MRYCIRLFLRYNAARLMIHLEKMKWNGVREVLSTQRPIGQTDCMNKTNHLYHGYCFPSEIISHVVWLYHLHLNALFVRYANNRAEVSHEHMRAQERQMRRFKSPGQAQRFLVVHSQVHNLFRVGRHLHRAANYRLLRNRSFEIWQQVTCAY